ncbi:MAG: hypothetical protein AAF441_26875 [Pseudomonadota bacterium]
MSFISGWVVGQIEWIMFICGLLAATALFAFFDPKGAMLSIFEDYSEDPVTDIMVRAWGGVAGSIGLLMVWGSYYPEGRAIIVFVELVSSLVWVSIVLTRGRKLMGFRLVSTTVVDCCFIALFAIYLLSI